MKNLQIIATILLLGSICWGCIDKKPPTPEPEEYFSFYADGEYFDYPQIKGLGFGGTGQTLEAWGAGTAGYIISGYSRKDPVARGYVTMYIFGGQIPDRDTIILDGQTNYSVVQDFKHNGNNFVQAPPLLGKIIFSKRTNEKIEGSFEFQASKSGGGIITITNGKFAIIPKQ